MEHGDARAWIGVVAREHVLRGVAGGFAQLCHGKQSPLRKMRAGDVLAYYSPTTTFRGGQSLRAFTAVGLVLDVHAYQFDMGDGFIPWRRDVRYLARNPVPLQDLRDQLEFTRDPNWGFRARRGHFEVSFGDMQRIARAMGAAI
jgi:hypothetical protein